MGVLGVQTRPDHAWALRVLVQGLWLPHLEREGEREGRG